MTNRCKLGLGNQGLTRVAMGTGSVSNHLPGAARMQIRRPQRKRTQCSTVSLQGRPSQFSSCEGYHGATGTEAYGSRGSKQLAVVDCIPTLLRDEDLPRDRQNS